jgi:hypothetical protein
MRQWCKDGTFASFGYRTYQDPTGTWHINLPLADRKRKQDSKEKQSAGLTP